MKDVVHLMNNPEFEEKRNFKHLGKNKGKN